MALARASYSDASILALDDPLSALDARVAARLFDQLILDLLRDRTRLVATHQLEHALDARVDSILITHGPAHALNVVQIAGRASGAACLDVVAALAAFSFSMPESTVQKALEAEAREASHEPDRVQGGLDGNGSQGDGASPVQAVAGMDVYGADGQEEEPQAGRNGVRRQAGGGNQAGALTAEEERETGKVSAEVYGKYLTAVGGWPVALALISIQSLWQALQVGSDWWLSKWSQQSSQEQSAAGAQDRNLLVYAGLSLGAALMVLARTMIVSSRGLRGARTLFLWQTEAVVRAPMRFFETTPVGRILTRATEDQNSVDTQLCFAFGSLLAQGFSFAGQLLMTAFITRYMLIPVVPMLYVYVKITLLYLESSRELQRIQSIAKSPVLSHVSATASGAPTIRAAGTATRTAFVERFVRLLDQQQAATFAANAATQWFSLRLRLMGVLVLFFTTACLSFLRGTIPPGLVGLAITYGLVVEDIISSLVFYWQVAHPRGRDRSHSRNHSHLSLSSITDLFCLPPGLVPACGRVRLTCPSHPSQVPCPDTCALSFLAGLTVARDTLP